MSAIPTPIALDMLTNAVSRQTAGSATATALAPAFETRIVVLAQGAQFVDPPDSEDYPPTYLRSRGLDIVDLAPNTFLFSSTDQLVNYILFITTDRMVFREALGTENIQVIYGGHARHGQGPCFHATEDPGEWWNDGDCVDNGIFRMGYPYIAIPVSDVLEHYYYANPATTADPKPARDKTLLHPKLMQHYRAITQFALNDLCSDPAEVGVLQDLLPFGPYWGLDCIGDSGHYERHLLMKSGWEYTTTAPVDLAATPLACHVFCYFGCSTLIHSQKIVRHLRGWAKDGDNRLAYWTDAAAPPRILVPVWLFHLFSYPKESGFLDWEPSTEYARKKTNREMPSIVPGLRFGVI
jgi:hypothetical protein